MDQDESSEILDDLLHDLLHEIERHFEFVVIDKNSLAMAERIDNVMESHREPRRMVKVLSRRALAEV